MISDYRSAQEPSSVQSTVPGTGRIGFFLLGMSFLFWAFLMGGSMVDGGPSVFINTLSGETLAISSMVLTIVGIPLACSITGRVPHSGKYLLAVSSIVFAAINLAGYYFAFHTIYNGLVIPSMSNWFIVYLTVESSFYVTFVVIYSLFILPFLSRSGKGLLLPASLFAVMYLVTLALSTIYAAAHPVVSSIPAFPGDNVQLGISFFNPLFGVPGTLLDDGGFVYPTWPVMAWAVASNAIYAFIYFSGSGIMKFGSRRVPLLLR